MPHRASTPDASIRARKLRLLSDPSRVLSTLCPFCAPHTTTVSIQEFETVAAAALQCHGASEVAARDVAKALRRAQQRGNSHCGLGHLEIDCRQLLCGRVDGQAVPTKSRAKPGLTLVNAENGFAHPAFSLAAARCIELR